MPTALVRKLGTQKTAKCFLINKLFNGRVAIKYMVIANDRTKQICGAVTDNLYANSF